jgi:hypothetical protein
MLKYDIRSGVKKIKTKTALAISGATLGFAGLALAFIAISALGLVLGGGGLSLAIFGSAHAVTPQVVYDSLASVSPQTNYPSQPFQAQQTNEFGDYVHLSGTARILNTVKLTMSNWALQSTPANQAWCTNNPSSCDSTGYTWPITVNIYANTLTNDVPNNLLGSKTVSVHVPWRPEGDPSCGTTSNGFGWKVGSTCFNYSGLASNASFDLSSLNLTLPNDVIVGFVYNTQTYGPSPTGVDGPYNSLNIAVPDNDPVTVGTDDSSTSVFWNTNTVAYYSNTNCAGGTFCRDTNWGVNGTVAMQITATQVLPTSKDQCVNSGWTTYGTTFKNQGDCVSFVATNGKNQPSGPAKH